MLDCDIGILWLVLTFLIKLSYTHSHDCLILLWASFKDSFGVKYDFFYLAYQIFNDQFLRAILWREPYISRLMIEFIRAPVKSKSAQLG